MLRVPVVQTPDWFRVAASAINGWLAGQFIPQAEPPNPTRGRTYYDDALNVLRTWDGSVWRNHW